MIQPFTPRDFDDACEDCSAPAGAYCDANCPSGHSADDAQLHRERTTQRGQQ